MLCALDNRSMYFYGFLIYVFLLHRPALTQYICGGDINIIEEASFKSPNYPGVYPNSVTCTWRFRVPFGNQVTLQFQEFQLEQKNRAYVEIRDGELSTSPLLGKFYGGHLPPDIISSNNTLLVILSSDHSSYSYLYPSYSQQYTGFSATVTAVNNYLIAGNGSGENSSGENSSEIHCMTSVYGIGNNFSDEFVHVHLPDTASGSVFTSLLIGDRLVDLTEEQQENFEGWKYLLTETYSLKFRIVPPDGDPTLSNYFTFNQFTFLRFELVDCEIKLQLIFTPTEEPVSSKSYFYYISLDSCNLFNIYKCNIRGTEEVYITDEKFMCQKVETFSISNQIGRTELKWFIKQRQGKITIWWFRADGTLLWSTEIDSPISMKFFAVHATDLRRKKSILSEVGTWDLYYSSIKNKVLQGEWFTVTHKNMCLVITLYTKGNHNDIILHINIEKRASSQRIFEVIVNSSKIGWQIANKLLTWPEKIQNSEIRLAINTSYDDIIIGKIYTLQTNDTDGCTSRDDIILTILRPDYRKVMNDNVITLSSTDYKGEISSIKVLTDQDLRNRRPVRFLSSKLYGVKNQSGFPAHKCPPGFMGTDCEQGCGRNHFGENCNILCSTHSKECSGLLLCTPSAGCVCAPGYKGETCEEECETGFYGNNCTLSCGKCEESDCDMYTGTCSSCQPGYYLPLCKQKYGMTSLPPHVNVIALDEVLITPDFNNITGKARPEFYSIEYRKVHPSSTWIKYATLIMPPENGDPQTTVIQGLEHGIRYEVRIVLIDRDLGSYEEDGFIPTTEFLTQCNIPDTALNFQTYSNETSVTVSWQFENDETNNSKYWCPIRHYEVYWKEGWKWVTMNTTDKRMSVYNQLPGMTYEFKVRALTCCGFTSYSPSAFVSTTPSLNVTEPVRNIVVTERDSNSAYISWEPPLSFNNTELSYILEYKCILHPACLKNCSESVGKVCTTNTGAKINGLLSFSRYVVKVSASGGPTNNVIFATTMSDLIETPEPHTKLPLRTNTSIIMYWKKPNICSGIFKNYYYQVYLNNTLLKTGETHDTSAKIDNLIPHTTYEIRICVQLISGRLNLDRCLEVNVSTSASVPEKVVNLMVYKQGRNMLGVRWARPERIQGTLKSFIVTTKLNGTVVKSSSIEPTPCVIWPDLFCYSVTSLRPNKLYTISVSARSFEINADGPPATVNGFTKEKLPSAPENFQLIDVTSTTVAVQWDYPFLANGILRSFVLNVEETDQFEADKCCEIYPIIEIPIKEEPKHYMTQITGLKPASTYELRVSGKTVGFGPSNKLEVQTRPPQLPAVHPNVSVNLQYKNWQWQNLCNSTNVYSYDVFKPLIMDPMLLLVVTNDTSFNETGIHVDELDNQLRSVIPGNFYLTAEYTDEALYKNIGDNTVMDGTWGKIRNMPLKPQTDYQMAAVRVTEYNGIYNAAVSLSTVFILP